MQEFRTRLKWGDLFERAGMIYIYIYVSVVLTIALSKHPSFYTDKTLLVCTDIAAFAVSASCLLRTPTGASCVVPLPGPTCLKQQAYREGSRGSIESKPELIGCATSQYLWDGHTLVEGSRCSYISTL